MPNYVMNTVRVRGDDESLRALWKLTENEQGEIGHLDFNKVIPMPEALKIEESSVMHKGLKAVQDFMEIYSMEKTEEEFKAAIWNIPQSSINAFLRMRTDVSREEWTLGLQAYRNIAQYGAASWYDWCVKNWGTKWNACEPTLDSDENDVDYLRFETAWSAPHPILEKLSEMFPNATFEHSSADEDLGNNCGERVYSGGKLQEEHIPTSLREGLVLAGSLWELSEEEINQFFEEDQEEGQVMV